MCPDAKHEAINAEQITRFYQLFRGSPLNHYIRHADKRTEHVNRGITLEDVGRHLRGEWPSLLSVPTNADGLSHFAVIDIDRHDSSLAPVDWPALAWRITQLGLRLTVCRSTGGRGAWCIIFLREDAGYSTASVRETMKRYAALLGISEAEVYPKQDSLAGGSKGNPVNLPYHGANRLAFEYDGSELNLDEFLQRAEDSAVYGMLLDCQVSRRERRDDDDPMTIAQALECFERLLSHAAESVKGERNRAANAVTWFAARCALAGILNESEAKRRILDAVQPLYLLRERNVPKMLADCWRYGLARGALRLDLYPEDIACLQQPLLADDVVFQRCWDGLTCDFPTALAAQEYMQRQIETTGTKNAQRILRASRIADAVAHDLLIELQRQNLLQNSAVLESK